MADGQPVMEFVDESEAATVADGSQPTPAVKNPYPDCMIEVSDENMTLFRTWIRQWITTLESEFAPKQTEWSAQEKLYRAKYEGPKSFPFEGACGDIIPVVAMGVDPVHARLYTGIFKTDPVFTLKALKKSFVDIMPSVNIFIEFYQKHKLGLAKVGSPRLMELAKHGSTILKTVYDRETYDVQTYDLDWKVVKKKINKFSGPRVMGVSIDKFMFPAGYQHLQDCPIVVEQQRVLLDWLMIQQASGKIQDVEKIKGHGTTERTPVEIERQKSANQQESNRDQSFYYKVYEIWCDFDINGDGIPEKLALVYHYETDTFLQLRYNWYFHQRKPYTLIPYTVTNDSLHGIGLAEMQGMFQRAVTQWHQMANDNAYLANVRMFIASKDSQLEDTIRMYAGRVLKVNDPSKDVIPFRMADTYTSTLSERQNLLGMSEKRSGISDYLTGRESPIVGSRATATGTMALIDEGTKRVEQVMENIRNGFAEVMENCIYIWMQYGLDDIDDIVFGNDQVATDMKTFINSLTEANVAGAIAIDLTATDTQHNRTAQQQVQMAIIQVMMTFYEKFVQLGTNAIQAQQTAPAITGLMQDVADSARKLFKDLLIDYDITDPEQYLPELDKYIHVNAPAAGPGSGTDGSTQGPDQGAAGQSSLPLPIGPNNVVPGLPGGQFAARGFPAPAVPTAGSSGGGNMGDGTG